MTRSEDDTPQVQLGPAQEPADGAGTKTRAASIGTTEAVRQGQRQSAKEKHRGLKTRLIVGCATASIYGKEIEGCEVVLSDNKRYLAMPAEEYSNGCEDDHTFAGYFLPYPDRDWGRAGEGFVSTISDIPPQLNWIYVDEDTHELKYGNRAQSDPHVVGPWDVTKIDKRVTLEGWEGFMAVRYGDHEWALYFDRDDNALMGILDDELEKVEVVLIRKEMKQGKPEGGEEEGSDGNEDDADDGVGGNDGA